MPFIRYRTGDVAQPGESGCACGRSWSTIQKIKGRTTDFIVTPDGRWQHALSLIYVVRDVHGVEEFKIIQERADEIQVLVKLHENLYPVDENDRIVAGIKKRMSLPGMHPAKIGMWFLNWGHLTLNKKTLKMNEESYINGMLERTALFYDPENMHKIRNTVFYISGLGGVGAITAELLARWGVKKFQLLDMDCYDESNLNRQLYATSRTLGLYKADVAAERILEINPYADIEMLLKEPVDNENVEKFVNGAGMIIQTADSPSCQLFYRAAKKYGVPVANGYSTIIGCRIQIYDYRKPNKWFAVEKLRDQKKFKGIKDLTRMDKEELKACDDKFMHPGGATLNFITKYRRGHDCRRKH